MKRVRRSRAEAEAAAAASVAAAEAGAVTVVAVDGAGAIVEIVATAVIAVIAGSETFLPQAAARTQPLHTCVFLCPLYFCPSPRPAAPSMCLACHRNVNRRQLFP